MSEPLTIAQIARQAKTAAGQRQAVLLAMLKEAGENGMTLPEMVRALTGKPSPTRSDGGPIGHALTSLAYQGEVQATGRFRNRTRVDTPLKSGQVVRHDGGEVWVATNKD